MNHFYCNAPEKLQASYDCYIGVDGGGTNTRVAVFDSLGQILTRVEGSASGLGLGIDNAWQVIDACIQQALTQIGKKVELRHCALACGLAGVHNEVWAQAFVRHLNPYTQYGAVLLETDAYTHLLAAHAGKAGVMIALGTGSVAQALYDDGSRKEVGGWGFPAGDEASGARLGMLAIQHAQKVLDGRTQPDELSQLVLNICAREASTLQAWLGQARQTQYASLAPLVFQTYQTSGVARLIIQEACDEIIKMADALDPESRYSIALVGGLASPYQAYLPSSFKARCVENKMESIMGTYLLLKTYLKFY